MKAEKHRDRTLEKLLSLSKYLTPEMIEEAKKEPIPVKEPDPSFHAEAVLDYISRKSVGYVEKICKNCELRFATDYNCVGYCSNRCRAAALQEVGIQWDPSKSEKSRWQLGDRVPLIVPPEALPLAKQILQESAESLESQESDTESEEESQLPVVEIRVPAR